MNVVFKIDSLFPLTMVIELDDDLLGPLKNLTYSLLDKLKSILLAFHQKKSLLQNFLQPAQDSCLQKPQFSEKRYIEANQNKK